jgi:hypothetical protein
MGTSRKLLLLAILSAVIGGITSTLFMGCSTPQSVSRANAAWHAERTPENLKRLEWETGSGLQIRHAKLALMHTALCFAVGVPFCLKPPA